MTNITHIASRARHDNPATVLGRVYLVLRDASYWMDLDEIAATIAARFEEDDSTGQVMTAIHELMHRGEMIERRVPLSAGTAYWEYLMLGEWSTDGGVA